MPDFRETNISTKNSTFDFKFASVFSALGLDR